MFFMANRYLLGNMNYYHLFAVIILLTMGALMLFSMSQDSLTFNELAHIAAGFGYL